jgi:hypothetical protein
VIAWVVRKDWIWAGFGIDDDIGVRTGTGDDVDGSVCSAQEVSFLRFFFFSLFEELECTGCSCVSSVSRFLFFACCSVSTVRSTSS